MTKIHLITSSQFIQSGEAAEFKNGIFASLGLSSSGKIAASEFVGMASSTEEAFPLNVGKSILNDDNTYTFENWVINVGDTATITASGNFDNFCFIYDGYRT